MGPRSSPPKSVVETVAAAGLRVLRSVHLVADAKPEGIPWIRKVRALDLLYRSQCRGLNKTDVTRLLQEFMGLSCLPERTSELEAVSETELELCTSPRQLISRPEVMLHVNVLQDPRKEYKFGSELGHGNYGVVHLVTHGRSGRIYACKILRNHSSKLQQQHLMAEVNALHLVDSHLNIATLHEVKFCAHFLGIGQH